MHNVPPEAPMRLTGFVLICGLTLMSGCGRDDGIGGAQRSQPAGVQQEPTNPDDLRTGQGNVGGTSKPPGDPGISGEQGTPEEGGAGTATESGEIIGKQPTAKKPAQKRSPQQ
jgi:hypothetical protein